MAQELKPGNTSSTSKAKQVSWASSSARLKNMKRDALLNTASPTPYKSPVAATSASNVATNADATDITTSKYRVLVRKINISVKVFKHAEPGTKIHGLRRLIAIYYILEARDVTYATTNIRGTRIYHT